MLPVIVSFYTDDWKYPAYAALLKRQCDDLGLEHHIEMLPSAGNYLKNTCMKPQFIRDCLEMNRPILWIDVDGAILKPPVFFDGLDADFAAMRMNRERKRTWHVGTMFFRPSDTVRAFVDAWSANSGECSDESALEFTLRQQDWGLKTSDIPPEYFEIEAGRYRPTEKTVIYHRISSGESKKQQAKFFNEYEKKVI